MRASVAHFMNPSTVRRRPDKARRIPLQERRRPFSNVMPVYDKAHSAVPSPRAPAAAKKNLHPDPHGSTSRAIPVRDLAALSGDPKLLTLTGGGHEEERSLESPISSGNEIWLEDLIWFPVKNTFDPPLACQPPLYSEGIVE
jgi:hypothetical protein